MKHYKLVFFLLLFAPFAIHAQWEHKSFNFENINRDYWIYVPQNYNPSNPASLVVTLHGMGDNDTNFRAVGFNLIADTANFLVLVPNALPFNSSNPIVQGAIGGSRTWNSGAGVEFPLIGSVFPNHEINDVGFINAIVDETIDNYTINQKRVYVCGFSMGGFMTQRMAIESNGRYAAFATAAGTIGTGLVNPNPNRPIPIAHFNGTEDEKVNWESNTPLFQVYVDSMIHFWVDKNNCGPTPIHETLPDTQNDGFTVEHDVYPNGDDGSVLEVFKVNGAGHEWLGFNNDISYTLEMWKFFSRYSFETASLNNQTATVSVKVYPNPTLNYLNIEFSKAFNTPYVVTLFDMQGRVITQYQKTQKNIYLPLEEVSSGMYLLKIQNGTIDFNQQIIVK